MKHIVVAVAITGSVPRRKDNPAVPIRPAEQIESTHEAYEAGASLVHIHVRNDDESSSSDPDRFDPDWVLLCIGRDISSNGHELGYSLAASHQRELEQLAERKHVRRHIRFLGDRPDAPALLRAADLAVVPSHEEGFSNALIEKMAAALPIVATNVGGNAEALAGDSGIIVPAHEPAALVEAITRLVDCPKMRLELAQRARTRALALYSLDRCVDEYEAIYRALMSPTLDHIRMTPPSRNRADRGVGVGGVSDGPRKTGQ